MHLGEKVKAVRESKEYSQDYMSKRLGISQQEYSRLETGKIDISHQRFLLIAEILEKTPKEIEDVDSKMVLNSYIQSHANANLSNHHNTIPEEIDVLKKYNKALKNLADQREKYQEALDEIERLKEKIRGLQHRDSL